MDASATTPRVGLADSLERLGTETAFSVLARAHALHAGETQRLSYANSRENLALALERMHDFLERL